MVDSAQHEATIGGRTLVYHEWGPADASPLVCVHGFTGNGENYEGLARTLPDRRVLAPTLRGHGDSAWDLAQRYQVTDYMSDLVEFVDCWGLDNFDLLGTSLGGYIVIPFAAAHLNAVRRLVVHDISPEEVPAAVQSMGKTMAGWPDAYGSLEEYLEPRQALPMLASRSPAEQKAWAEARLRQRDDGRWAERYDPALIAHRVSGFHPPDYWAEFASLRCPVLVIWGRQSQWLSERNALRMVAEGHDVRLLQSPDEGHVPDLLGSRVHSELVDFLA